MFFKVLSVSWMFQHNFPRNISLLRNDHFLCQMNSIKLNQYHLSACNNTCPRTYKSMFVLLGYICLYFTHVLSDVIGTRGDVVK